MVLIFSVPRGKTEERVLILESQKIGERGIVSAMVRLRGRSEMG
jgi:hypothetical protein